MLVVLLVVVLLVVLPSTTSIDFGMLVVLVVLPSTTSIDLLIFDRGYVWCEGRASAKILYL